MPERPAAPTAPEVVLETDTGPTVMSPGREDHVGRDPLTDIVIDDARVSWHHAVLRADDGHWPLEDERLGASLRRQRARQAVHRTQAATPPHRS